ncbi:MAG: hypothetical protein O4861_16890 [Trichodesmium sp. St16_bin4-tuft]|uniref:hypothetical protein n=1 Tax=Trichodesmium erythraeum TaxID=1206 RepID=UPI00003C9A2C|nr:hypothetical protein [Trichodesmium erythraeum GBRTRLIN201]MCH2047398.1 hypothetical protein [Trichodesmium sp. ALOHA_ZT_67]MDE5073715.1 hypothetical protein [Trichodesmium sp. St5_bin8]MDE5093166.1 hypothetical protein [Trichodesmium sp. St11_bin5]MDE5099912.1 hypothetical protein [Trichodesmium sp. St16_bin4-tuft]MDT9340656.1 hypothetical protein [Trichodesmium erythraeum 21-75]
MGEVYRSDRSLRKTHLALELSSPQRNHIPGSLVNQNYQNLEANYNRGNYYR